MILATMRVTNHGNEPASKLFFFKIAAKRSLMTQNVVINDVIDM
jgi:hypothetical protein